MIDRYRIANSEGRHCMEQEPLVAADGMDLTTVEPR